MKSNCYFEECKYCINRNYNDELICCLTNRLSLTWHRYLLEMPFVNKLVDKEKHCPYFEKR